MSIPSAPDVLSEVVVDGLVAPTSLTPDARCRLRAQGRDSVTGRRLGGGIESPAALLGTAMHKAIELADGARNLVDVFETLVARAEVRLEGDTRRRHLVPLSSAAGTRSWNSVIDVLTARTGAGPAVTIGEHHDHAVAVPVELDSGHEVGWESPTLGLRARVDLVEQRDDVVRITDWKSGRIFDDAGEIKVQYRLQLAAYSMLCRERWPRKGVKTFLFDGNQFEVEISDDDEALVVEIVARLRSGLEAGRSYPAMSLASPGDECGMCSTRQQCPAYRETLGRTGRGVERDDGSLVGDAQGRLVQFAECGGYGIATIETPAGELVQLRGLTERFELGALEGETLLAIGLIPQFRKSRTTGEQLRSNTLLEVKSHDWRAWQSEIFVF